ncbi:MAG: transposase [Methylocella sp.]
MFKVLLLRRWHGLSDPAMEAALCDRVSFMAFAGLSLSDPTPDHATIWRFREKLGALSLVEPLLTGMNRQPDAAGVVMKQGTLIDASLVTSAARRPRMDEGKTSKIGKEARFGTTNERVRFAFGHKPHVAADAGSGLVLDMKVTPANERVWRWRRNSSAGRQGRSMPTAVMTAIPCATSLPRAGFPMD